MTEETKQRKARANEAEKYKDGDVVEVTKGKRAGLVGTVIGRSVVNGRAAVVIDIGEGSKVTVGPRVILKVVQTPSV